jgi:hypothetical protein
VNEKPSGDNFKLRENRKGVCYQALNESLMWLRTKNSGMVIMPHMKQTNKFAEIDNPHPSTSARNDLSVVKVQRLNGIGSEECNQLQ